MLTRCQVITPDILYFMDVSLNLLYASNVENQDIKNGSSGFPGEKLSPSLLKDDV